MYVCVMDGKKNGDGGYKVWAAAVGVVVCLSGGGG